MSRTHTQAGRERRFEALAAAPWLPRPAARRHGAANARPPPPPHLLRTASQRQPRALGWAEDIINKILEPVWNMLDGLVQSLFDMLVPHLPEGWDWLPMIPTVRARPRRCAAHTSSRDGRGFLVRGPAAGRAGLGLGVSPSSRVCMPLMSPWMPAHAYLSNATCFRTRLDTKDSECTPCRWLPSASNALAAASLDAPAGDGCSAPYPCPRVHPTHSFTAPTHPTAAPQFVNVNADALVFELRRNLEVRRADEPLRATVCRAFFLCLR